MEGFGLGLQGDKLSWSCVNENNEGDQSKKLESQPPFYIFGNSDFLKLKRDEGGLFERGGLI